MEHTGRLGDNGVWSNFGRAATLLFLFLNSSSAPSSIAGLRDGLLLVLTRLEAKGGRTMGLAVLALNTLAVLAQSLQRPWGVGVSPLIKKRASTWRLADLKGGHDEYITQDPLIIHVERNHQER